MVSIPSKYIALSVILFAALGLLPGSALGSFYVGGMLSASNVPGPGTTTTFGPYDGMSYLAKSESLVGAEAKFIADLNNASLSTYASAVAFPFDRARSRAMMGDVLTFTVPAGMYANGVQAVFDGHVDGTISKGINFATSQSVFFAVGDGSFYHDTFIRAYDTDGVFGESFQLVEQLVAPGETLTADTMFLVSFDAYMLSVAETGPDSNQLVDFYNTGAITGVVATDGTAVLEDVTWTSESGCFLAGNSTIPEPSTLLIWGIFSVLSGIAVWRRR
ncbi:MAG: hypothetical protein JW818_15060 [Pirellulales bacterium]|nr:hypothetical protein [Pirellulales bacterium]